MNKSIIYLCCTLLLVLVVAACSSPTTEAPPAAPALSSRPAEGRLRISAKRLERSIHYRINRERRRHGLPSLRWDGSLGRIAARHSRDMATRKYFNHISPEGRTLSDRYLRSGYACGVTVGGVLLRGAENIFQLSLDMPSLSGAEGTGNGLKAGNRSAADAVLRGWLDNGKDRQNLLSSPWRRDGVGVFVGPDGRLYVTVNFC